MKEGTKSAAPAKRNYDGLRQRCVDCGHPRREHRHYGCSVPKCPCHVWAELAKSVTPPA
jgi:hypothetical protein